MRKGRYLVKRLIYIVFVFFITSILMFAIYKSLPGDPVRMMMGDNVKPEVWQQQYDTIKESLGLDKPVPVQYVRWMGNMLRGDFGYSTEYRRPVKDVIGVPMRNTVVLNLVSMFLVFIVAVPLGIAQAVKKNGIFDKIVQVVTIVGYSVPSFVIALLAIYILAIRFPIFPISGVKTAGFTGTGMEVFLDSAKHMVLPVLVMSIGGIGSIALRQSFHDRGAPYGLYKNSALKGFERKGCYLCACVPQRIDPDRYGYHNVADRIVRGFYRHRIDLPVGWSRKDDDHRIKSA